MSDLLALIRSCKTTPEDDFPRRVLADWLEEHGDPERAEFIRLQCHGSADSAESGRRQSREQELLSRNRGRWLQGLDRWVQSTQGSWTYHHVHFQRGFLHLTDLPNPACVQYVADLSEAQMPWIESLRINYPATGSSQRTALLGSLVQAPFLAGLVELSLAGTPEHIDGHDDAHPLPRDVVRDLLAIPDLPLLRKLSLCLYAFTPDDLEALVEAPWFAHLTHLTLIQGWAGRSLCRLLGARRTATALTALKLHDARAGLDDAAVAALATATHLTALRALDCSHNQSISDAGLRVLANSALLGQLGQLSLMDCAGITDAGIAVLANSLNAGTLRELDLSYTNVGRQGAVAVVRSPVMAQLRLIDLRGSALEGELRRGGSLDELPELWAWWRDGRVRFSESVMPAAASASPAVQKPWWKFWA